MINYNTHKKRIKRERLLLLLLLPLCHSQKLKARWRPTGEPKRAHVLFLFLFGLGGRRRSVHERKPSFIFQTTG